MVMVGLSSLRGATRCFQLISEFFKGGSPCHVVIQDWIMRFGFHKLLKPVENIKRGVEDFLKEKPGTKYTYDITHKVGILLKHPLENDANWNLLVNLSPASTGDKTCETKRSL